MAARRETTAIACFAIGGLVLPFALFPLWWLATRDHPVISLEDIHGIGNVILPGGRFVFLGLNGPRMAAHLIVIMWLKALVLNVVIYTAAGAIMVLILRMRNSLHFRWSKGA